MERGTRANALGRADSSAGWVQQRLPLRRLGLRCRHLRCRQHMEPTGLRRRVLLRHPQGQNEWGASRTGHPSAGADKKRRKHQASAPAEITAGGAAAPRTPLAGGGQNQLEDRASVRAPSELLRVTQGAWKPSRACLRAREGRVSARKDVRTGRQSPLWASATLRVTPGRLEKGALEQTSFSRRLLKGGKCLDARRDANWFLVCMFFLCTEGKFLITITVYC